MSEILFQTLLIKYANIITNKIIDTDAIQIAILCKGYDFDVITMTITANHEIALN